MSTSARSTDLGFGTRPTTFVRWWTNGPGTAGCIGRRRGGPSGTAKYRCGGGWPAAEPGRARRRPRCRAARGRNGRHGGVRLHRPRVAVV